MERLAVAPWPVRPPDGRGQVRLSVWDAPVAARTALVSVGAVV